MWGPKVTRAGLSRAPLLPAAQEQSLGHSGWAQGLHFFHQLPFDKVMMLRDSNTAINQKKRCSPYTGAILWSSDGAEDISAVQQVVAVFSLAEVQTGRKINVP